MGSTKAAHEKAILKIIKDIEKLKNKWEHHEEDFEQIFKYVII